MKRILQHFQWYKVKDKYCHDPDEARIYIMMTPKNYYIRTLDWERIYNNDDDSISLTSDVIKLDKDELSKEEFLEMIS